MAKEVSSSAQQPLTELNACVSAQHGGRRATKNVSTREWLLKNQIGNCSSSMRISQPADSCVYIGISLTLMAMLLAVHNAYPSLRPYTSAFIQLSHYNPEKGTYVQGSRDIYFAIGSVVGFTAARAIIIDWIFQPIAQASGLKRKTSLRFAEQGWLVVYYGGYWSFGMVRYLFFLASRISRMLTCLSIVYLGQFRVLARLR